MTIPIFDYSAELKSSESDFMNEIRSVLNSGCLMLGPKTEAFENEFASFIGTRHCIGVSSGTAALQTALMAEGVSEGDEVITVANTCSPTATAIRLTGAVPVFIDVSEGDLLMDFRQLSSVITEKTKAIVAVHLWGNAVVMEEVKKAADKKRIAVIEDCAQAHGTVYEGKHAGVWGKMGCFSFYPTKNLGAYGDAGAVVTDDDELAAKIRSIREYGYDENKISQTLGMNARISEIQSAILSVKLKKLNAVQNQRTQNADYYLQNIRNENIKLPETTKSALHGWHQFVIRTADRSALIKKLENSGIGWGIHYPVPLHRMAAFKNPDQKSLPITEKAAEEILSIPVGEHLSGKDLEKVAGILNSFRKY